MLPPSIAENLLARTDKGREQMKEIVEKHLNTDETSFWDPVTSLKIKRFSTTTKKTSIKSTNEKLISVSADRDLFGRLLMAANARQINLRDELSYELSTVLFALSHQDGTLRKTSLKNKLKLLPVSYHQC